MIAVRQVRVDDDDGGVRALAALRVALMSQDVRGSTQPVGEQFHRDFRAWFEESRRVFLLAEDDTGGAIGMCNVDFFTRMPKPGSPPSCWAYLANMFVLPEHRGGGVGGQLIQAVIDCARTAEAVRLVTAPSECSRSLYERHGFGAADGLLVLHTP